MYIKIDKIIFLVYNVPMNRIPLDIKSNKLPIVTLEWHKGKTSEDIEGEINKFLETDAYKEIEKKSAKYQDVKKRGIIKTSSGMLRNRISRDMYGKLRSLTNMQKEYMFFYLSMA